MRATIFPSAANGMLEAVSSKSAAHRLLICAAFADMPTRVRCDRTGDDIAATVSCLCALGAKIVYSAPFFEVTPIKQINKNASLDCGESGSTLRFLLPVCCMLGADCTLEMRGRLSSRPLSPLYEELIAHGARLSPMGESPLVCGGRASGGVYKIRGDVSSQFISGLLFALTVSGKGGEIIIEGELGSKPYIDMTVKALSAFGASPTRTPTGYTVSKNTALHSPHNISTEGDWSGAAFPLCMAAISGGCVTLTGLCADSAQGDRAITDVLRRFGAEVTVSDDGVTVRGTGSLCGIELDASQIPDLVPAVAAVAAYAKGRTVIYNASRLRLKESDRIESVCRMLSDMGVSVTETNDGLIIEGGELEGGEICCAGDHRIAMSAAVAALGAKNAVTVIGAECVSKSYPDFWEDVSSRLGVGVLLQY